MRVCIAIGACVVRTTGAVTGGAWDGVAWLGIDEGYYRYFAYYAYDYYPYDYYADFEPYYNNERNAIKRHYCNAAATVPLVFPQMRRVWRDMQLHRGARDVFRLSHRHEIAQAPQFHGREAVCLLVMLRQET